MLPFLQPKKMSAMIIAKRSPEGKTEDMHEEGEHPPGLMAAAEDLAAGVANKDTNAIAAALKAAFEVCDAYPHEEGEEFETAE